MKLIQRLLASDSRAARLVSGELARGSASLGASMLVSLALQAVYFVVLARTLGASGFGVFAAALAAVSLAVPFATWGTGNLLVRDASVDPGRLPALRSRALLIVGASGALLLLLLVVVSVSSSPTADFMATLVLLGTAELIFGRIAEISGQCMQSQDRLGMTGVTQIIVSATRLGAALVLAALVSSPSPTEWAALYLGATVVAAVASIALMARVLPGRLLVRPDAGPYLRSGFFFALGSASKTAYSDIDKVMLLHLATAADNGIYTAAYRVITLALTPVRALVLGSNTRFFRAGARSSRAVWALALRAAPVVVIYGAAVGGALFLAAPMLPALLGPSYADAASALRWLALLPLVESVHYLFGDALMGTGRQQVRSLLQLGTVFLNIGLNIVLIPLYSWRGAAVASVIAELCLAIAVIATLYRMVRADAAKVSDRTGSTGTATLK